MVAEVGRAPVGAVCKAVGKSIAVNWKFVSWD